MENNYFCIAEHHICIRFADSSVNTMALLPSFTPFREYGALEQALGPGQAPDPGQGQEPVTVPQLLFTLTVDDNLRPAKQRKLVRKFDTGNGDTLVYQLPDGGYQYIIRDVADRDCCLLICNEHFTDCQCALNGDWTMRSFGLNDALMLIFAFAGSFHQTLLIHASCIMLRQPHQLPSAPVHTHPLPVAFPFTAKSGTGKSTHTSLWMKHIEGSELMNDDNPIIRIDAQGTPYIYGSPWSGKTPCYRNVKALLGAVTRIERASQNSIVREGTVQAFALLLPACSSMKWDTAIYNNLCDSITKIIATTPIYTLYCRPDEEAARVCFEALVGGER